MSRSLKTILTLLVLACLLSVGAGFVVESHHAAFAWESFPGFYAAYGFVGVTLLVLVSKYLLRPLVMRREDQEKVS